MAKLFNIQQDKELYTFIPKRVTDVAMLTYVAALLACSVLYSSHILDWKWWIFGLVEVLGFFYFANHLSKTWINFTPKLFIKKLFWTAFILRVIWVVISYLIYTDWTGTPFTIDAADELTYNAAAQEIAEGMRQGNFNIYALASFSMGYGTGISDLGYPMYLGVIYWIFGDSVIIARLIKAALSAWTAVLMYKLATRNFGEYTGRMTAILCMLMPNLIYYCSFQLKEVEMVFLCVLFVERADYLLRQGRLRWWPTLLLMLIPGYMFMIRTALAAVMVMAFFLAVLLTTDRIVKWGQRALLTLLALVFASVVFTTSTSIGQDVYEMWETGASLQEQNMEWRSQREGALSQRFARYAGASVFAPMIFTIPFPTMAETPGQENQKMIHGGNFVKNILSAFTLASMFILLFSGDWRKHVLPIAVLCGYLVVLVFSNFAQSERFHMPILSYTLMFAAYGISKMNQVWWVKRWYPYWCALMFIAAIAWNWFKLAGRGMI